jgi:hypothetical protein
MAPAATTMERRGGIILMEAIAGVVIPGAGHGRGTVVIRVALVILQMIRIAIATMILDPNGVVDIATALVTQADVTMKRSLSGAVVSRTRAVTTHGAPATRKI